MIPRPGRALTDLAMKLALGIAPEAGSAHAQANAGLMSMLLIALAQDFERAAANRLADIDELRVLFTAAVLDHPEEPAARSAAAWCDRRPEGYRISELDAFHADGMAALIELQVFAEAQDGELNLAIWDFLARHTERNRFDVPNP